MYNDDCQVCPFDSQKSGSTCLCDEDGADYDIKLNMCVCQNSNYFKQEINGGYSC